MGGYWRLLQGIHLSSVGWVLDGDFILGNMIFNAVQFLTYGQMKQIIGHGEILTLPQTFTAGAFTGVAVAFVETPMDLLKSQLQVQIIRAKGNPEYKAEFTTVGGAIKKIISVNGIFGCYQGFCTTLLRDVIAVSLYFGVYEWYRRMMLKDGQVADRSPPHL